MHCHNRDQTSDLLLKTARTTHKRMGEIERKNKEADCSPKIKDEH